MVDRVTRDKFAKLLDQFFSGSLTNFEYESECEEFLHSRDLAIQEIYSEAWEHRMVDDHAISDERRLVVSRWISFLRTSLEYEWPRRTIIPYLREILSLASNERLGYYPSQRAKGWADGDATVWPYFRRTDFEEATPHHSAAKLGIHVESPLD